MTEHLRFILNKLSFKRVSERSSWWIVGAVIYNVTGGSEEGNNIWHLFSQQDSKYNETVCEKKWREIKCKLSTYTIKTLAYYISEDENKIIHDKNVREFVYDVLLPKLLVRRTRNLKSLNNLCSALYHISAGNDRDVIIDFSKRIKDKLNKKCFIKYWDEYKFNHTMGINDIIYWVNNDTRNIHQFFIIENYEEDNNWLEITMSQLKEYDDEGYKPRYLKGYLGNRAKRLQGDS